MAHCRSRLGPNAMKPLFDVRHVDRECYKTRLRDFMPERLIDAHAHVWLDRFKAKSTNAPVRTVSWPARVALDSSIEDLEETYRLLLPDKRVTPLFFSN